MSSMSFYSLFIKLLSFLRNVIASDCGSDADIIFILDSSGSISDHEYVTMQQFVGRVVERLGVCDEARFGLVVFSDSTTVYVNRVLTSFFYYIASNTNIGRWDEIYFKTC